MAAAVSAWAKPGAWALDSEEHESELLKDNGSHDNSSNDVDAAVLSDYPSLTAAAATKSKKKSKGQKLSFKEFTTYSAPKQLPSKGLTPDELMALPTGPRERSADEIERPRLGGGFKSYGYDRPGRDSSDEQPRRQRDTEFTPSRADETDDWGANKKSSIGNGFDRREKGERGGFFPDSKSRADDVDSWVSNKSFVASDTRRYDRRGGFESNGTGGGANSDNWLKKKEEEGGRYGNSFDTLREKRGVGLESSNGVGTESDTWSRSREEGSGRPRLNLQRRTLPVGEGQQLEGSVSKPRGSNPFGNARPREEVLKEKGQDPKEIEEKLEAVKVNGSAGADGPPAFGKMGFGTGSWRNSSPEDKKERSWRKPEPLDASRPSSSSSSSAAGAVEVVEGGGDAQVF